MSFLLSRIAQIFVGYLAAVAVAVLVTIAAMILPTALPDDGAWRSLYKSLESGPSIALLGLMITLPTALPGFLIAVFFSLAYRWRSALAFAVAGAANALPSLLTFNAYLQVPLLGIAPGLLLSSALGGFAGGATYWLVAGRHTAAWRTQP